MPEDPQPSTGEDRAKERAAAAARIANQGTWVDLQLQQAMERGDFTDLPGFGKPLELGDRHDPDWWVKQLIEREKVVVAPLSVQLRREDAGLDARLDALATEADVRREVADFNDRVRWALYRPPEGPPVVTGRRDPDQEVERWRVRRQQRLDAARALQEEQQPARSGRRGLLRRRSRRR